MSEVNVSIALSDVQCFGSSVESLSCSHVAFHSFKVSTNVLTEIRRADFLQASLCFNLCIYLLLMLGKNLDNKP